MAIRSSIVIGGGLVGMLAAFRLPRASVKVKMVERDDRVCGHTRSKRIDGYIVDVAAALLPGSHMAVDRLLDDAGLPDMLAPMTSPTVLPQ